MPYSYQYPHPAVAVDACVFTIDESKLRILLIRRAGEPYKGHWALPGGFVNIDENLEQAMERELKEETGASGFHFEQLETFGEVDRDPRERVISVAYLALAAAGHVKLKADSDASEAAWFAIDSLPDLAFDHASMVSRALKRVRAKLDDSTVAFEVLPKGFTLSDLQQVYDSIQAAAKDK